MNKEIKKKWVEALRSGKYKQGRAWLRKDDEFCCLGVLCDVISPEPWDRSSGEIYDYHGDDTSLSEEMHDATEVLPLGQLDKPVTYMGAKFTSLASLNDAGATFEEIADVIEEQF